MKLETIWSLKMPMSERFRRTFDLGAKNLALKLPQRVRYWATVTELAKAARQTDDPLATLTASMKNIQK